jgi:acetyltransferase-like isoleucine patch superfamily enzyme
MIIILIIIIIIFCSIGGALFPCILSSIILQEDEKMKPKEFYAHPQSIVEGIVGNNTKVWAWAHVMEGAVVGDGCTIGEHAFIESGAVLGNNVRVKNGVSVWNGITVEDDVILGPGCVLTNDKEPRAGVYKDICLTVIRKGASIGAGAIILCGIEIGEYASVGAGSVVTASVPPYVLVYGNPARQHGFVCKCGRVIDSTRRIKCECGKKYVRRQ